MADTLRIVVGSDCAGIRYKDVLADQLRDDDRVSEVIDVGRDIDEDTHYPHIAPTFPVIGGGVHPGTVETYMGELGPDIILGAGGAIQGHPDGAAAGADAMRQAIDAVMAGQRVGDAAQEHPELRRALEKFGSTV